MQLSRGVQNVNLLLHSLRLKQSSYLPLLWFRRKFLTNLGLPQTAPIPVFADNETCIAWSEGSVGGSDRAKHVDLQVRMHFVHEARAACHLQLLKMESRINHDVAYSLSTSPDVFSDLRRRVMGY